MRLLELVATRGSLSAAALQLGVSQPGATKMMHELEAAFGCNLIDRGARGGRLSVAGSHALGRLRVALGELDAAREALARTPEVPMIRIGMLPLVSATILPHVIGRLDAEGQLPRLVVREATVDRLLDLMVRGELDCVIGRLESREAAAVAAKFNVKPIWPERTIVVASVHHPMSVHAKIPLVELLESSWVLPPLSSYTRRLFDQHFLDNGLIPPVPQIESMPFHTNLRLVTSGRLLTIAPEHAVQHYEKLGLAIRPVNTGLSLQASYMLFLTPRVGPASPGVQLIEQAVFDWANHDITGILRPS
ncbi:LysR substrate-binding domain-containing protein [Paraburkholderia domus]|uniref:LysR substrate-binding domain-containing protein n=1 Tax=Paraburkholderia domus TaxID=2793075 RepID=UPI001914CEAD|nr:LysR substrate-binding domain-containing protein [Paraburkholderia domus]MBK5185565.1 LysR family transcriptional regulator [Burkholderia sp. R-69749]